MEKVYGWTGKILRIDLTTGKTTVEKWDHSWIGGRGFGQWALFNEEPADAEELDPRSVLIFSSGSLNGTMAPSSSRLGISSRSIITDGCSYSSSGGFFASEMKYAGYDHIIISGKADRPIYIFIKDGDVKISDAAHLWGKTTGETESILRNYHSDLRLSVACIGPAGENLVRFSCIMVDRNRAAGWGGNGALMGSKKLKAIAIRGTKPIYIAHPKEFLQAVQQARQKLEQAPSVKSLRRGGTLDAIGKGFNPLTYRNYQDESWEEGKVALVTQQIFKDKYEKHRFGCFNCGLYCGRFYGIDEGKYAGIKLDGVQVNTLRGFGSNLDIASPADIIKANAVANEYGLNVDAIASVAGWVFDCFEKGIITENDLGYKVKWGDINSFLRLTTDITYRRGMGDILAEGIKRASMKIGKGSEELAVLVKGVECNEGRLRSHRAWAFGIMTSPRGGGHLDGAPNNEGIETDDKLGALVYGIPNISKATDYEYKAQFVVFTERLKVLVDMLGLCFFTSVWSSPLALEAKDYAGLYATATGDHKSAGALLDIAEKVINIQKAFNTLHAGFSRQDDYPPRRLVEEPIKSGPYKGTHVDRNKWDGMLDEYYELHNWDRQTGRQTRKGLERLDLEQVAERLSEEGRLII
jgi:aldehyde:ferredoxin oxidoreductase